MLHLAGIPQRVTICHISKQFIHPQRSYLTPKGILNEYCLRCYETIDLALWKLFDSNWQYKSMLARILQHLAGVPRQSCHHQSNIKAIYLRTGRLFHTKMPVYILVGYDTLTFNRRPTEMIWKHLPIIKSIYLRIWKLFYTKWQFQ